MPPPPDPRRTIDALVTAAPLATRWIERVLAGTDPRLSVNEFLTLRSVRRGQDSAAALAEHAAVSAAAVSQLVGGLVAAGLVRRSPRDDDRRRLRLQLTAAGRTALDGADRALQAALGPVIEALPPPEIGHLHGGMLALERALVSPPPRRPPHRPPPPPHHRPRHPPRPR